MDIVILIGRIAFALLFIASGYAHFSKTAAMTGYAESLGVKPAKPLVLLSGLFLIVGGAMVATGAWADVGALVLVAFLLPTAFLMHPFWKFEGEQQQTEMVSFMKDLSLAGAALALFGLFVTVGSDLGYTITGPIFP
ncbi:MAG: DoxX family protein [Actinomycetota bacterium]|nr:DoxX family protein [Actinomycetota bacterium]MDK1017173.1 DoxX family protein [Actinomycetota bacterium]MDK1027036.1 DoxX family protein [Actinomycetota bacterium]MDK1039429.1 DoxX family protein [Actinomycetota bacterium]MDK1097308.1 DoxX family protein [Actinomycetota bacterium]